MYYIIHVESLQFCFFINILVVQFQEFKISSSHFILFTLSTVKMYFFFNLKNKYLNIKNKTLITQNNP